MVRGDAGRLRRRLSHPPAARADARTGRVGAHRHRDRATHRNAAHSTACTQADPRTGDMEDRLQPRLDNSGPSQPDCVRKDARCMPIVTCLESCHRRPLEPVGDVLKSAVGRIDK